MQPTEDMADDDGGAKPERIEELTKRVDSLERDVDRIQERNVRVELDKAWEASSPRVLFLLVLTYCATSVVFWLIAVPRPLLNALIPTTAYYLSTLSLPILKKWWIERRMREKGNLRPPD